MQDNSLQDRIQGNWKQLSGGARHEWGKLTHNDVEEIKGSAGEKISRIGTAAGRNLRHGLAARGILDAEAVNGTI